METTHSMTVLLTNCASSLSLGSLSLGSWNSVASQKRNCQVALC